jgi:environmental stress-induced protein Ves
MFLGSKLKVAGGSSRMPVCGGPALDADVPAFCRQDHMPLVEPLLPEGYRRIPWKNGRGELVVIDSEGGESWQDMGVAWHFGRTIIIQEGPFSDYTGYERLQVVTKGVGLVLVARDHEIDMRLPMHPQRYDGGTAIRTQLEKGPVEVVNLIANRARFDIDLRVGKAGAKVFCRSGRHVVFAPVGAAHVKIDESAYTLAEDHALRVRTDAGTDVTVQAGQVIVGSIHDKR